MKIPFNVWEICKKEGDVPVKVRVADTVFVCNLEPEEMAIITFRFRKIS